jgi:hypothetical protein
VEVVERTTRWQLIAETLVLAGGAGLAGLVWPRSWDDMAGAMVLFSFPCCVLPSVVHLLAVPLLMAAAAFAWYCALRMRVVPVGLVAFTAALGVGFVSFLVHSGDSAEFPPVPYLWWGWGMLVGAVICTAELRWRGRAWAGASVPLWAAVPVFVGKPFTDIAFAGV